MENLKNQNGSIPISFNFFASDLVQKLLSTGDNVDVSAEKALKRSDNLRKYVKYEIFLDALCLTFYMTCLFGKPPLEVQ